MEAPGHVRVCPVLNPALKNVNTCSHCYLRNRIKVQRACCFFRCTFDNEFICRAQAPIAAAQNELNEAMNGLTLILQTNRQTNQVRSQSRAFCI